MDAATLTFGIKDVVAIVVGALGAAAFIYALRTATEKNKLLAEQALLAVAELKKNTDERFLHAKNSKKANIEVIMDEIAQVKSDVEKKETSIYNKITEIRTEQKEGHDKLSAQITTMSTQLTLISNNMSELTGYIKAKKEEK